MKKLKRSYLTELWWNRPWKYIPDVVRYMKWRPYRKERDDFWKYVRNCLYINWQTCWKWVGK